MKTNAERAFCYDASRQIHQRMHASKLNDSAREDSVTGLLYERAKL